MKFSKYILCTLVFLIAGHSVALGSVIVTEATGGEAILASSINREFTPLSNLVITETDHTQIGMDDTDLVLKLPEGFEFDTSSKVNATVVNVKLDNSGNCTGGAGNHTLRLGTSQSGALSVNLTPLSNSVSLHIKQASAGNCKGTLTFSGMKVRPTVTAALNSFLAYEGTADILGLEKGVSSLGTLNIIDDIEEDITAPVITLNGEPVIESEVHTNFIDPGAQAIDDIDGEVDVEVEGVVDIHTLGEYTLTYRASDLSLNSAETTRTVSIVDTTPPTIVLNGNSNMTIKLGNEFVDPGALANDNYDEDIDVASSGEVDTNALGEYILEYNAIDSNGNEAETVRRTVTVVLALPPTITLIGSSTVVIEEGDIYTDSGAKAFNEEGEDISENITVEGLPIPTAIGEYTILYRIIDSNGLEASIERKVEVKERKVVVEETSKPRSSRGGRNTRDDEDISNFDIPIMPQVLGAETKSCDAEKLGGPDIESLKNNPEEIKKLQQFLNDELVLMLPVNGSWDDLTSTAFEIFEGRYVKDLYTVNPIDLINQKICS